MVRGQGVLVVDEQLDDLLVELIEGRVTYGDLAELENGGRVVIDVLHFGSVAEKFTSGGLETAIVPAIGKHIHRKRLYQLLEIIGQANINSSSGRKKIYLGLTLRPVPSISSPRIFRPWGW